MPTASYVEMTEWALPADESGAFHDALARARAGAMPEARFLRGGFWRNFQARYREVNDLHKQMLRVSAKVAAMPDGPQRATAVDHLQRGQSNDCYWHGLFGGIYIVHMRMATLHHLIAAEDLADAAARASGADPDDAHVGDWDLDGRPDAVLASPAQLLTVDLDEGAGISTWDLRASRVALLAAMRRRPEAYHARLIEHDASAAATGDEDAQRPRAAPSPSTTSWRSRRRASRPTSNTTVTSGAAPSSGSSSRVSRRRPCGATKASIDSRSMRPGRWSASVRIASTFVARSMA